MTEAQYLELTTLYREFPELTIIAVPCNQFGSQEPWTAQAVEKFARSRYGFGDRFWVTEKLDVNGVNECNLYKFLKREKCWYGLSRIAWNFSKESGCLT